MENRFNLVDENWIPVVDKGLVSLRDIFTDNSLTFLGGTAIEKISVLKLLLAIAQTAVTPMNIEEWKSLGAQGLATKCLLYIESNKSCFYLYGDKPFLQMVGIQSAEVKSFGTLSPEVSTGNTTILNENNQERVLLDSAKALLLLVQMGFSLGGKKTDNSVVLSEGYLYKLNEKGKPSTGKPGPSLGFKGFLHSFCVAFNLQTTLWINLLTKQDIERTGLFSQGLGAAPWESMPMGEGCAIARNLQCSYIGRLVPLARFCLLGDNGVHYSEGVLHDTYKNGIFDLSVAVNRGGKDIKATWVSPDKRPWRELTALLSFFDKNKKGSECFQLIFTLDKVSGQSMPIAIWSGGLSVSYNAGEQYVSGDDDSIESLVWLDTGFTGEIWFERLKKEMDGLEMIAKRLYACVSAYLKMLKVDNSKIPSLATNMFWEQAETRKQELLDACGSDCFHEKLRVLRLDFSTYIQHTYDYFCTKQTARQIDAWAQCIPKLIKYINQEGL